LDLGDSKNIFFADDEDETSREVEVGVLETKQMFKIKKVKPFTFAPKFKLEEIPISLEEQMDYTAKERQEIEDTVSVIEEAFKTMPFEIMSESKIKKAIKKLNVSHFVDPHFAPRNSSIHSIAEPYPYKQIVHWRRPHEFMKNPKIFVDDVDPNDIKQGILPDCWFLSALSCLAERPALIHRLFITDKYNKEGIYKIRICKNGEWHVVTIDDYIPCYYNGGPMFSRGNGEELWVMLIEKAYAKMHGSYYSLRFGYTHHGMIDLTGCPTTNIKFPDEKPDYETVEDLAEDIWEQLMDADESGHLISGETPGVDEFTEGGGLDSPSGLVPGHAYSIIRVHEGCGVKLLNIRNPWGKYEWDGEYSDTSDSWTKELKKEFKPVIDANDGSFWM
jgi:calpain-15